jgi:triacylglycerol lipase
MSALGLVGTEVRGAEAVLAAAPRFQLFMEDAFASPSRLWFRGRLEGVHAWLGQKQAPRRWWQRWRRASEPLPTLPALHVHTKIGAYAFDADVPVTPDGRFEVLHAVDLPLARRGWRVARHNVTFEGRTLEACNLVLEPAEATTGVMAVVLPLEHTRPAGAARQLATSDRAARLGHVLDDLARGEGKGHAFYYLAAVPDDAEHHQGELALAITARGWPAGSIVLLRVDHRDKAAEAFEQGLDRLRWLFAGSLDVHVVNLEPSLTKPLATQIKTGSDRAEVRRLLQAAAEQAALEKRLSGRAGTRLDERLPLSSGRPTRGRLVPKHPVVFCHGMLAMSLLKMQLPEDRNYFAPLRQFFRDHGFRVLYPQVSPTSGVAQRAVQLKEQILRWTDEPVNIIAHSMGGLDARQMITHLGMADRVASLTTLSTPHRGTYLADWFIANFRNRVPLLLSLQALGVNVDGFRDCCLDCVREFNTRTPNAANVRYYSYGASVSAGRLTPALRRAWTLLTPVEGPNDGMVSVASATWGEYLGTIHADHYAQTPDATFVRPGENFDHLGFYSRLVEDLARRGL